MGTNAYRESNKINQKIHKQIIHSQIENQEYNQGKYSVYYTSKKKQSSRPYSSLPDQMILIEWLEMQKNLNFNKDCNKHSSNAYHLTRSQRIKLTVLLLMRLFARLGAESQKTIFSHNNHDGSEVKPEIKDLCIRYENNNRIHNDSLEGCSYQAPSQEMESNKRYNFFCRQ